MSDSHSTPRPACVYFVLFGDSGPIKIGRTTKPLDHRLHGLQTGSPEPLRLMGFIPESDAVTERLLHERFRHLHYRGEWFEPGADLLAFIRANAEQPDILAIEAADDHETIGIDAAIAVRGMAKAFRDSNSSCSRLGLKLSEQQLTRIRWADWAAKYAEGQGMTLAMIAALYRVTESTVSRGIRGAKEFAHREPAET